MALYILDQHPKIAESNDVYWREKVKLKKLGAFHQALRLTYVDPVIYLVPKSKQAGKVDVLGVSWRNNRWLESSADDAVKKTCLQRDN